jgi:hypothetical protein
MVDWEITATTIFCESVDDEVTLIVSGDGTVKCGGRQKYEKTSKETNKLLKDKSKAMGKQLKCNGEACNIMKQYRDRMLGEK